MTFDEHCGISRNAFFAAGKAKFLGGCSLNGNVVDVNAHHFCQTCLHLGNMCFQLRTFSTNGGIDVAYRIAFSCNQFDCLAQQNLTVYVVEVVTVVGEVVTNVAHIGRTQQGIADGMNENIGIAVSE